MKQDPAVAASAFATTCVILALGYMCFGLWTALIFTSGFLTGYLLWLFIPNRASYATLRVPYFVTLALFVVHRVEEKVSGFFAALARLTSFPTPDVLSIEVIALVAASVGAWLSIPLLLKRGHAFGFYLAWTFFAAMGITELAHFVFPVIAGGPYGYFPGMATAAVLAPAGLWGMTRLARGVP